jgi:hypothetical protein
MRNEKVRAFVYMLATVMMIVQAGYWAWKTDVGFAITSLAGAYFLGDEAVRSANELVKKS